MKKNIIIGLVICFIVSTITGLIIVKNKRDYKELISTTGIKNIEVINYEIPKFSILTSGMYTDPITQEDIKDLKKYKFKAVIDNGVEKEVHTYVGVKVNDVIQKLKYKDFNHLTFMSSGHLQVMYNADELTDNVFWAFEVDGKKYPQAEEITLINPDVKARYNLTCIVKLVFD